MFRKFVNGLVFGAGFGVALITVLVIYGKFFSHHVIKNVSIDSSELLTKAPKIKDSEKFLGSPGVYSGDFLDNKSGVLAGGEGIIVGLITLNGEPLEGLKLRLALNDSVMSQWTISNSDGIYMVKVPYGEYKIDGFELDQSIANLLLAGKIDHPHNAHTTGKFEVSEGNAGEGLNLNFIDPIEKKFTKRKYSQSDEIILNWEPYPGATEYSIQIYEKTDAHAFVGNDTLFKWSKRPNVAETTFNLKEYGVKVRPNHYYLVDIKAKNDKNLTLSETHMLHSGYDFEVTN